MSARPIAAINAVENLSTSLRMLQEKHREFGKELHMVQGDGGEK